MPIKFENRAQNYANSRGLQNLPQGALQKLDQDRSGVISLEEASQKGAMAGLDGDGQLSAEERSRLSQLLGVSLPTTPVHSTQPTTPSVSSSSSPLKDFLEKNPDIKTNQDMINVAYRSSNSSFARATHFVEALGLKMSDLTSNRSGSISAHISTRPTPSTRPSSSPSRTPETPPHPSSQPHATNPSPSSSSQARVGLHLSPELLARHDQYDRSKLQEWSKLVNNNLGSPTQDKLFRANAFFNSQLMYASDKQVWQKSDYWASPVESLAKGGGDCDDFAISKYVTLRKMGVPAQDLKLAYVYYMEPGKPRQAHMVLLHQPPGEKGTILDNIDRGLKTIEERKDLVPVFTFNETGLWYAQGDRWSARISGTSEQLSKWQDAIGRMRNEGIW